MLDLPAFPIFRKPHSLAALCIETLGPLFGGGRAQTQDMIEFLSNGLDMLSVIVFPNLYINRGRRRLQSVGSDVITVLGQEGEGQGGAQCRGGGKEQACILTSQSVELLRGAGANSQSGFAVADRIRTL